MKRVALAKNRDSTYAREPKSLIKTGSVGEKSVTRFGLRKRSQIARSCSTKIVLSIMLPESPPHRR